MLLRRRPDRNGIVSFGNILPEWVGYLHDCSTPSYEFAKEGPNSAQVLLDKFDIPDSLEGLFLHAFEQVCSGSGNEKRNILRIHSSSLVALLHFFDIRPSNPVTIAGVLYDKVFFETQNDVEDSRKPSNVDIVLVSKDEKTILFLESKFTEPLSSKTVDLKSKPKYVEWLEKRELYDVVSTHLQIKGNYCEGFKQMISHLRGIAEGKPLSETNPVGCSSDKTYKDFYEGAERYILGSILMDEACIFFEKKRTTIIEELQAVLFGGNRNTWE